ncbi:unnamed protein product [Rhizoctonia solani]|uniref:Uncharacterized protein n=1 Tax=Rhizoctonia solani TaxID=456999 RepID=A0A8H3AVS7_9AGAM|nr:unnamed protein product [Rhizoctonia solani]
MRLTAGGIREMHLPSHCRVQWEYVIDGSCRVSTVDQLGHSYLADVASSRFSHMHWPIINVSTEGLNNTAEGYELLLDLDDGTFIEDFLPTERPDGTRTQGAAGQEPQTQRLSPTQSVDAANPQDPSYEYMAKAQLQLSDETIPQLQKVKPIAVGPGEW